MANFFQSGKRRSDVTLLTVQGVCFDLCKVISDIYHSLKVPYDMLDF